MSGKEEDRDEPAGEAVPEGWSEVASFERWTEAQEAGLAVLAMGRAYWMVPREGGFVLCVESGARAAVAAELADLARLRSSRRAGSAGPPEYSTSWWPALFYGLALGLFYALQALYPLEQTGAVDAEAMLGRGELWRAVTALTLHADVVHLVANIVSGAGFAFFVARYFGAPLGWFLILLSGALGNLLNAWVAYPEAHHSIGASTAVFGALGLITGVGLFQSWRDRQSGRLLPQWLLPAFGGLTLLGLLGMGSGADADRIDVAAHISGFLCGLLLGLAGALGQGPVTQLAHRRILLSWLTPLVLLLAWAAALSN